MIGSVEWKFSFCVTEKSTDGSFFFVIHVYTTGGG